MALGIGFHMGGTSIDFSLAASYLDQGFYEALFRYYQKRESCSRLKAMVAIGYDDEFFLGRDQVPEMLEDFQQLLADGSFSHPQATRFCEVLREAASRNCGLVAWGDMHPDLSRG